MVRPAWKTWLLKGFSLFGANQSFYHSPETFNFTKMWHFYFHKAIIDSAPFSGDFSKASFVSRVLLLANVTLLYSMFTDRKEVSLGTEYGKYARTLKGKVCSTFWGYVCPSMLYVN